MAAPTLITDLSQTPGSNGPDGASTSPSELDDYQRAHASFIAQLRDGKGHAATASVASAATTDIGAVNSLTVEITGTTSITSLGTAYSGPRFLRFAGVLTLTHSASLNLPGAANIVTAAGDTCLAAPNLAANGWNVYAYQKAASTAYTLGAVRTYASTDTWTKPANLRAVRVRVQAPGGGGGGSVATALETSVGSGGGGGGYSEKFILAASLASTETVTIGAAGTAGSAAGGSGGTGGTTSFGTHSTATGGVGGASLSTGTTASVGGAVGTGGTGASGDVNAKGAAGQVGIRMSGTNGIGGGGGASFMGGGGSGGTSGGSGNGGGNYGGGGGGGNSDSTTGRVGGVGGAGIVIVEEFY